jgi:hypothetical protein
MYAHYMLDWHWWSSGVSIIAAAVRTRQDVGTFPVLPIHRWVRVAFPLTCDNNFSYVLSPENKQFLYFFSNCISLHHLLGLSYLYILVHKYISRHTSHHRISDFIYTWKWLKFNDLRIAVPYFKRLVASFPPRLPRFEPRSSNVTFVVDKSGTGAGFLRVLRFPLPIRIPTAPHTSSIIWGWYKNRRRVRGQRTKCTQSHPTPRNKKTKKFEFRWMTQFVCCETD